ncbi:hypothetical protein [Afipia sp. GAS231]|uniref:hypothetical protein n=1 Tax=Afipia sp. GAS231 TaxID=1882747 RepID=UPI00087CE60A|nr:hypothetical protein [Afipia sp. GAS231]SDO06416.1 hypothetical protein SAMN05444050_3123 [Afipia sp. GAS231]
MIDLHERLSEFSYGYGITRDVEALLSSVGVRTVPFMPSLLQEKQVAFDVGFGGRGVPLILQFKLGHSLRRFVRSDKTLPAPSLQRPFFRFSIHTAEPDGQFETLLKAELDGAEAYYVAPRFTDWPHYVQFFESGQVLERSVLITPSEIRASLVAKGLPDGTHRIVYDPDRVHVCSEPTEMRDVRPELMAANILTRIRTDGPSLGHAVHNVFAGMEDRAAIRRASKEVFEDDENVNLDSVAATFGERAPQSFTRTERNRRLIQLKERARSEEDAIAAALGFEFWSLGIQMILAVQDEPG